MSIKTIFSGSLKLGGNAKPKIGSEIMAAAILVNCSHFGCQRPFWLSAIVLAMVMVDSQEGIVGNSD